MDGNSFGGSNVNDAIIFSTGAGSYSISYFNAIRVRNGTRNFHNNTISNIHTKAENSGLIVLKLINAVVEGTGNFRPYIYDSYMCGSAFNERITVKNTIDTGSYLTAAIHVYTGDKAYININLIENIYDSASEDVSLT